jgi:hypothetical protein
MANTASWTLDAKIIEGTATQRCDLTLANDDATVTQYLDDQVIIPGSTTDLAISLASVSNSAKHMLVTVSGACTIKLQLNTAPGITFPATGGAFAFIGGAITAMYITNPGTTAITVKRVAAA